MGIFEKELIRIANSFADKSRKILKKNYLKRTDVEEKKDGSFVTNVDKEIELLFRSLDPKYFRLFDISNFLKSFFKYPFKSIPFVLRFERITASPSFEKMPFVKTFSFLKTNGLS